MHSLHFCTLIWQGITNRKDGADRVKGDRETEREGEKRKGREKGEEEGERRRGRKKEGRKERG